MADRPGRPVGEEAPDHGVDERVKDDRQQHDGGGTEKQGRYPPGFTRRPRVRRFAGVETGGAPGGEMTGSTGIPDPRLARRRGHGWNRVLGHRLPP